MISINPKYLIWILRSIPNFLWPIKWYILKKSLKKAGKNFRFSPNSIFIDQRQIEIGDNVFFGNRTTINTSVLVRIGNNVMFGPEVMIIGGDHNFHEIGSQMSFVKSGGKNIPILIEDDVWIGARVLILKGVTIGEGAVIGAGSVVTRSVPPYSINIGVPSKPIRLRFNNEDLKKHLYKVHSKYSCQEIIDFFNIETY